MIDQYSLPPDGRSARSGISEVQRDAAVRRASLEMMKKQHQRLHLHNKHDTKDVQSEQMTAYVKAWDKLADTSMKIAFITGIVFMFSLHFVAIYDVQVFVYVNTTQDTARNKLRAEIGELLHAIFAILMATCVTSGLIGTILLSTHGKIIKNAQFQVLKYGLVTQRKVKAKVELLASFDQIADVARFMGLIVCSGCFYMAVCVYFYQKLLNSPFGDSYGATPAGIVVVGIMTLGATATMCIFVCMTCRNFRHQHLINDNMGQDWLSMGFNDE